MRSMRIGMIAFAAIPALLAGCDSGSDPLGDGKGQVRFVLTSAGAPAPAGAPSADGVAAVGGAEGLLSPLHEGERPSLQSANVTFTSVLARTLDGQLVNVAAALPATVDVLQVVEGRQLTLPIGFLPPGTYDQLVVVMSSVELVRLDGTRIAITPPGGGWTAIVNVASPFTVVEGQTTTLELRFRWWSAFREHEGGFQFHPAFDCDPD